MSIIWNRNAVVELIKSTESGREFARIKTPWGWRTKFRTLFKRQLEGQCFANALCIAAANPDKLWYCEGYANGLPHAWLSPKIFKGETMDEDWAIDITWPYKSKYFRVPSDKLYYAGIRIDGDVAKNFLLNRAKEKGKGTTSCSLLKYHDEIKHLLL